MSKTLAELAALVGGKVLGDASLEITAANALSDAGEGEITFVEKAQYTERFEASRASAAFVDASFPPTKRNVIVVADPFWALITAAEALEPQAAREPLGVHPHAHVHPGATIGQAVSIYPGAFVDEGAVIGDRCEIRSGTSIGRGCRLGCDVVLHPNVVLYPQTQLGDRVTIHACSVIGADGFGYRTKDGRHVKIPQRGFVQIGDDVEIGACTTIDRGTFGATRIAQGTKIDNQVMVGHNCRIGKHNLLVSQTGFAGSCETGDYVVTAGQAGIRDHVTIGTGARIGAQAGVIGDVPEGAQYIGSPAIPDWEKKRLLLATKRLPDVLKTVRQMEKKLARVDGEGKPVPGPHARIADPAASGNANQGARPV